TSLTSASAASSKSSSPVNGSLGTEVGPVGVSRSAASSEEYCCAEIEEGDGSLTPDARGVGSTAAVALGATGLVAGGKGSRGGGPAGLTAGGLRVASKLG